MADTAAIGQLYHRQLDIIDPEVVGKAQVLMVGAGGIGSPTALALAKMGVGSLTVYDHDTIEEHNLPNQMYPETYEINGEVLPTVGESKVQALGDLLANWVPGMRREECERKWNGELAPIVISAVDNMETRAAMWKACRMNGSVKLFVDGRMAAETCMVYAINPIDPYHVELYESTLYSDSEAAEEKCTAKAIIYNTMMAASLICNVVKRHLAGQPYKNEVIIDLATMITITR